MSLLVGPESPELRCIAVLGSFSYWKAGRKCNLDFVSRLKVKGYSAKAEIMTRHTITINCTVCAGNFAITLNLFTPL